MPTNCSATADSTQIIYTIHNSLVLVNFFWSFALIRCTVLMQNVFVRLH